MLVRRNRKLILEKTKETVYVTLVTKIITKLK